MPPIVEKHILKQTILIISVARTFLIPIHSPYHELSEAKRNSRQKSNKPYVLPARSWISFSFRQPLHPSPPPGATRTIASASRFTIVPSPLTWRMSRQPFSLDQRLEQRIPARITSSPRHTIMFPVQLIVPQWPRLASFLWLALTPRFTAPRSKPETVAQVQTSASTGNYLSISAPRWRWDPDVSRFRDHILGFPGSSKGAITGCIEGYPEPENHVRKAYKRTNMMNVFCI